MLNIFVERLAGSWVQQGRPLPAMENMGQPIPGLETFQSVSSLPQVHSVPASSTMTFSSTYTGHTVHKLYTNPCTSTQYTLQPVLKQKPKPEVHISEYTISSGNIGACRSGCLPLRIPLKTYIPPPL